MTKKRKNNIIFMIISFIVIGVLTYYLMLA